MTTSLAFTFDHLDAMTDARGLFEHATGDRPNVAHGYCTDDNARMLVVTSREPDTGAARRLSRVALGFTIAAQDSHGRCRNRLDRNGRWTDRPGTNDCWGRSSWALGAASARHQDPAVQAAALTGFDRAAQQRSRWPRAMAFAALGAADVLSAHPEHIAARRLLTDAAATIGPIPNGSWAWPEERLTYANAALAEAVIAAGVALEDARALDQGLTMLGWLLSRETSRGHLSVTGVGGRGPHARGPQFDQQPIEVAAMADACWRAFLHTGDTTWSRGIALAAAWFSGDNDTGAVMRDDRTGGGFDGLRHDGVNVNQGAESSLALVSTLQRAQLLVRAS